MRANLHEGRLVEVLNGLIDTCCAASDRLEAAAQGAADLEAKKLLRGMARERRRFEEELRQEVERLGHAPPARPRPNHRAGDCRGSEDACLGAYEVAVGLDLPDDLLALLRRHFGRIQVVRDQIPEP